MHNNDTVACRCVSYLLHRGGAVMQPENVIIGLQSSFGTCLQENLPNKRHHVPAPCSAFVAAYLPSLSCNQATCIASVQLLSYNVRRLQSTWSATCALYHQVLHQDLRSHNSVHPTSKTVFNLNDIVPIQWQPFTWLGISEATGFQNNNQGHRRTSIRHHTCRAW